MCCPCAFFQRRQSVRFVAFVRTGLARAVFASSLRTLPWNLREPERLQTPRPPAGAPDSRNTFQRNTRMKNPASLAAVVLRKHSVCLTATALWIRKRGDPWDVFREAGRSRFHSRRLRDRTRELISGGMEKTVSARARRTERFRLYRECFT